MVYLGIGMLVAALAMLAFFRPDAEGTSHPVVTGPAISALYPTLLLALIAFGIAILVSRLLV